MDGFFPSSFEAQGQLYSAPAPLDPAHRGRINVWTGRYEDEVPLLEGLLACGKGFFLTERLSFLFYSLELGISFTNISSKTILVLNPLRFEADSSTLQDADLTGPLVFGMLFGIFLLMVE